MSNFISIDTGAVKKSSVTGITRRKGAYPWNGEEYFCICIHLQGTVVEIKYDNKVERNQELERLLRELDN